MNVGIVGCGLIGQKRARTLTGATLVAVADVDSRRAGDLAGAHNAEVCEHWQALVTRPDIDAVIVATPNNLLAAITQAAAQAGKHVLVEKPAARTAAELKPVMEAARQQGVQVRVGFNHRYHPAFIKAQEIVTSGKPGEMMFVRGRYGHGGRVGYEKEWRADPEISGGGELLDQGVHLIDLARLFLGDFPHVQGFAHTYFWPMPVDDNGFMLLRTAHSQIAQLHVSWTEWKNLFSFELYGRDAKLHIEGLGGSYGVERLSYYQMRPEMGPPETTIWEYPGADCSWEIEFREFVEDIAQGRTPSAGLADAYAALQVVEEIYRASAQSAKQGQTVQ